MFNQAHDRKSRMIAAQGMTEYIIIVSLVAIGCITAVTVFGQKVARIFHAATAALDSGKPEKVAPSEKEKINTGFTLQNMQDKEKKADESKK